MPSAWLSQSCPWSNLQYQRTYAATYFRNSNNNIQQHGQLGNSTRSTIFAVCLVKVVLGQTCNTNGPMRLHIFATATTISNSMVSLATALAQQFRSRLSSAAKWTRPARPAPNPNLDPEGQPDSPLFAPLRSQPDSTRFCTLGIGFNPIQPLSTRIKTFDLSSIADLFLYFCCCCISIDLYTCRNM